MATHTAAPEALLAACGAPAAWRGRSHWTLLDTDAGTGAGFLTAWRAWQGDPHRPARLHYAGWLAAAPPAAAVRAAHAGEPALHALARALADQWWGLVPGVHRLQFEGGRVLLTLHVGDAVQRPDEAAFAADAVLLADAPGWWEPARLKALARCCHRGSVLATARTDPEAGRLLAACGFRSGPVGPVATHRFDPAWTLRHPAPEPAPAGTALVVGGGLAGAAAAASLARRGWQVEVLDAADRPAAGASDLPAGLLAPHTSPDDNLLSRLSRAGVRVTLEQARAHLQEGRDWAASGTLERRGAGARLPDLGPAGADWQRWDDAVAGTVWHAAAGWIRPRALVEAWLAQPGVRWRGGCRVAGVAPGGGGWRALDAGAGVLAQADLLVVAAALGSAALVPALRLHGVRGQVSWGLLAGEPLLPHPVNGDGHFLPGVRLPEGDAWLSGSTYGRGDHGTDLRREDDDANLQRLQRLVPQVAAQLAPAFAGGGARAWAGVRCTSSDRRPLVGCWAPGAWVSTAMASRGLSFAALCAELVAARLHAEPWPLAARLARALDIGRQSAGHQGEGPQPADPDSAAATPA